MTDSAFPDDAPDGYGEYLSVEYDELEFERFHRDVAGEPTGGACWESDDEQVTIWNFDVSGHWAVEASEIKDGEGCRIIDHKNGVRINGLSRTEALKVADSYLRGEIDLEEQRCGQQSLASF